MSLEPYKFSSHLSCCVMLHLYILSPAICCRCRECFQKTEFSFFSAVWGQRSHGSNILNKPLPPSAIYCETISYLETEKLRFCRQKGWLDTCACKSGQLKKGFSRTFVAVEWNKATNPPHSFTKYLIFVIIYKFILWNREKAIKIWLFF